MKDYTMTRWDYQRRLNIPKVIDYLLRYSENAIVQENLFEKIWRDYKEPDISALIENATLNGLGKTLLIERLCD